jgi:soluble cytochrome b562
MKTLDTRDLKERKEELEAMRDAVTDAQSELDQHKDGKPSEDDTEEFAEWEEEEESLEETLTDALHEFRNPEKEELEELEELESEISDFNHGETMIPVDDWEDYARELAEDLGAIDRDAKWPNTCIDWEQAANELAMDYTIVSYQGDDYYVRS